METKIPEVEARNILSTYEGSNNQLLEWKRKFVEVKNFKLTRPQSEYVFKFKDVTPKVARKHINIVSTFGEKIMEERLLPIPPTKIWCEKLLCESDKAFHIWGKVLESDQLNAMWLPKSAIVQEEKKLNRVIDYSPYSTRPPMEHQKIAVEKLLANDKFILADDMGLGKTTSAIIASLESKARKILIVCPASLKINWQREIKNYSDRKVLIVEGRKWGSTFDFYIINYDIIKNYHTTDKSEDSDDYKLLVNANFDLAIVDEAHYISNATANRTRLLNDVLETIPKVWLLTGTPMTSRPINYFNLLNLIESPVAQNWMAYAIRYCEGYQFKAGPRKVWNVKGASNLEELRERTSRQVLRRLKQDVLDLPDKIITPVYLRLKSRLYEELMGEYFDWFRTNSEESSSLTLQFSKLTKNHTYKMSLIQNNMSHVVHQRTSDV